MSYTKYISDNKCGSYLDAQLQTANNMLFKIVHIDCQNNIYHQYLFPH